MYRLNTHQLTDEGLKEIYPALHLHHERWSMNWLPAFFWVNVCDQGDFTYLLVEGRHREELAGSHEICAVALRTNPASRRVELVYGFPGNRRGVTELRIEGNIYLFAPKLEVPSREIAIAEFPSFLAQALPPPSPRGRLHRLLHRDPVG